MLRLLAIPLMRISPVVVVLSKKYCQNEVCESAPEDRDSKGKGDSHPATSAAIIIDSKTFNRKTHNTAITSTDNTTAFVRRDIRFL